MGYYNQRGRMVDQRALTLTTANQLSGFCMIATLFVNLFIYNVEKWSNIL